uniref:Uncharacterized protein n=1 Tax=Tanacetum cinerariifolium TaxID=118510 RepID=A0A6L2JZU8_TANCI|nr:hypothetical protein [Tanacetum cinerariifolium]
MHTTTRGNIAYNFLRLKEGGIYSVKNFDVGSNEEEYWVIKNATFMLEFNGATTIRKAFVKPDGFIIYSFQLVEFDNLENTNNKYLIGSFIRRHVQRHLTSTYLTLGASNKGYPMGFSWGVVD